MHSYITTPAHEVEHGDAPEESGREEREDNAPDWMEVRDGKEKGAPNAVPTVSTVKLLIR